MSFCPRESFSKGGGSEREFTPNILWGVFVLLSRVLLDLVYLSRPWWTRNLGIKGLILTLPVDFFLFFLKPYNLKAVCV